MSDNKTGPPDRPHQPGVTTTPPEYTVATALAITVDNRDDLAALFDRLATAIAERTDAEITVSVGASLFDDRFGLADLKPHRLTEIPSFAGDVLDEQHCHGDLLIQVGAESAKAASKVAKELGGIKGLKKRWRIDGFRSKPGETESGKPTTVNRFGFTEGIGNPDPADVDLMNDLVWVQPDGEEPKWTVGGSYLAIQLIRFAMSIWDSDSVERQELVFGRDKDSGAPLGLDDPEADPDFDSDPTGERINLDSHIRRANPRTPETEQNRILRRSYNYDRGKDSEGQPDAGLIFACYQQDLERGFATVRKRLEGELLDKYILTFGGGYFFTLPGGTTAQPLGAGLLEV